jgi:hypothetical protein
MVTLDAEAAKYRIEERCGKLSGVQRFAHDRGWWRDQELMNWEGRQRGTEYGVEKQGICNDLQSSAAGIAIIGVVCPH